jgi:hypothetical protein
MIWILVMMMMTDPDIMGSSMRNAIVVLALRKVIRSAAVDTED